MLVLVEKQVQKRCILKALKIWKRRYLDSTFNVQITGKLRNKKEGGGAAKVPQKIIAESGKHWVCKYKSESDYKEQFGASFFQPPWLKTG